MSSSADLKDQVRDYWDAEPCGTAGSAHAEGTAAYFEAIESFRYRTDPGIHAFAQFTRYRAKRVLEVGVGAGTDFLQWARAGADAWGVDLTQAGVDLVKRRLSLYGLTAHVQVADAEQLPFPDNHFDLVYSYGVIHHTPDTYRALSEIVRVTKPGGEIKVMLYNRHSVNSLVVWLMHVLMTREPFHGLRWALARTESPGTKAFTHREIAAWAESLPLQNLEIRPQRTYFDYQRGQRRLVQLAAYLPVRLGGDRFAYFMRIKASKSPLHAT